MHNKVVLITGAARRIGASIARQLHDAGASVVVHYHNSTDAAERLVDTFNEARPRSAMALQADIRELEKLPGLVTAVVERYGRLDGLVNNASTFYPTPIGEVHPTQWHDLMRTNLGAPLFLSQAAAPHLSKRNGAIVNLVDIHALRPLRNHPVYCAAKAGLDMLTRSLARELGPAVRVNGVSPGPILWPENGLSEQQRRDIVDTTALKRHGEPADIAGAVLFLMQDATYVTGQILAVDGGRSI